MFGFVSLYDFPLASGWCLSEDSYAEFLSSASQGMALAHGMDIKLGQALVGHSLCLCPILVHVPVVGRTHFRLQVLWVAGRSAWPLGVLTG